MPKNEDDFAGLVARLDIDDAPRPGHKEQVRRRMLLAHQAVRGRRPLLAWVGWRQSGGGWTVAGRRVGYAVAAILPLAVGAVVLLMTLDGGNGVAFADVGRRVRQARTITWKCEMTFPGDPPRTIRYSWKHPGLTRSVATAEKKETIIIRDHPKAVQLSLTPSDRTATVIDMSRWPAILRDRMRDEAVELRRIFDKPGRPLGVKTVKGRKARGYQVTHRGQLFDVWVDPRSAEPIALETWIPGGITQVMSEFTLDRELDDSLFSVTPPPEYAVQRLGLGMGFDPKERDLTRGLKLLADHNDNTFPSAPALTPAIVKRLKALAERHKKLPAKQRDEQVRHVNHAFWGVVNFVYDNPGIADWRYVGGGVKLGDAKRPICWYRPADSDTYRVVFGDLSARDAGRVPPTTRPAK